MADEMLKRSQCDKNLMWDLSVLFKSDEACMEAVSALVKKAENFNAKFKGKVCTAESIKEALKEFRSLQEEAAVIQNYVFLGLETDYTDSAKLDLADKGNAAFGAFAGNVSFLNAELSACSDTVLNEVAETSADDRHTIKNILKNKKHQLDPKTEEALAYLSPVFQSTMNIYGAAMNSDLKFENFTAGGKEYPLSFTGFEGSLEYETDTEKRRTAYEKFYEKIADYENTLAANYQSHLNHQKITAKLRGYKNVFEYLLADQNVTEEMYNRQIDIIMEKLAPHMRKYAKFLQKIHGLDKMTYADLKLPVDPSFEPAITLEQAKEYVLGAVEVMGKDYTDFIKETMNGKRIDYVQNIGKASGAFCSSPYRRGSFILMSWAGVMADVFTLVHELGHAGHFNLAGLHQNILDVDDVSTYFVEAPSTMNEMLLSNYLIGKSSDNRMKRWTISSLVSKTYYHNFVTHLLEAHFQRKLYRLMEKGESVASRLSELKLETLREFWADAVEVPEYAGRTWMRQAHYYMGLYPYTYSAGLTISTAVSRRILAGDSNAVVQWKEALKAGGSVTPIEFGKMAGVDLNTAAPFEETIEHIGNLISEIITIKV